MKKKSTVPTPLGALLPCVFRHWAPPTSGDRMVNLILYRLCGEGDPRSEYFLEESRSLSQRCPNCYWPILLIDAIADGKEVHVEERPSVVAGSPSSTTIVVDGALFARGSLFDAVLPNQVESLRYVPELAGFLREFNMDARWRSLLHQRVWQPEGWEPAGNLVRRVDLHVRVTTTDQPSPEVRAGWSVPSLQLFERTKKEALDRFFASQFASFRARDLRLSGGRLPDSRVSVMIILHDTMATKRDEMTWALSVQASLSFLDYQGLLLVWARRPQRTLLYSPSR